MDHPFGGEMDLSAQHSDSNTHYTLQPQQQATGGLLAMHQQPSPLLSNQSKRKEKARIAARLRRSQEAIIITEMANELEIAEQKQRRIDKATIVKLAIDYIKAFEVLCKLQRVETSTPAAGTQQVACPLVATVRLPVADRLGPSTSTTTTTGESRTSFRPRTRMPMAITTLDTNVPTTCKTIRRELAEARSARVVSRTVRAPVEAGTRRRTRTETTAAARTAIEPPPPATTTATATTTSYNNNNHDDDNDDIKTSCLLKPFSAPKLSTASIFAPKTVDNMNSHYLMIELNNKNNNNESGTDRRIEEDGVVATFVLKPDAEIQEEDDLTHLAPQAGDVSISLEVEPLDGIEGVEPLGSSDGSTFDYQPLGGAELGACDATGGLLAPAGGQCWSFSRPAGLQFY